MACWKDSRFCERNASTVTLSSWTAKTADDVAYGSRLLSILVCLLSKKCSSWFFIMLEWENWQLRWYVILLIHVVYLLLHRCVTDSLSLSLSLPKDAWQSFSFHLPVGRRGGITCPFTTTDLVFASTTAFISVHQIQFLVIVSFWLIREFSDLPEFNIYLLSLHFWQVDKY